LKSLQNPLGTFKANVENSKFSALLCNGDLSKSGISGFCRDGTFIEKALANGNGNINTQIGQTGGMVLGGGLGGAGNGKKSRLDDILKNADRVVESVRQSLKTMAGDRIDSSVDEDNTIHEILAFSVYRGAANIQIGSDEVNIDNCSFVSFDAPDNLKRMLALPPNLKLRGTASNSEFLDHVNRLVKKLKKKDSPIDMTIGYLQTNPFIQER
jgi:hypothetical protein